MGAGISGWPLARAVSKAGHLGVVAGTALDIIMARRLQVGDPGGHIQRALSHLPVPGIAVRILDRYYVAGGKAADAPFRSKPMIDERPSRDLEELIVASNFVEIFLAKEGHDGQVGVNYLDKIKVPTLPSLFGAMLADVDFVLMGAGIPVGIPGFLDTLSKGGAVEQRIDVLGALPEDDFKTYFDPSRFCGGLAPALKRPLFLAIVSTAAVGNILNRKATGKVDGFIIEAPTAGGHNAPPRGKGALSEAGEPIYGPRDDPDFPAFREFGRPFWMAGSRAEPRQLQAALAEGATGIQVGTAFAFCNESGLDTTWKARVLEQSRAGVAHVFTDARCSPTGFPFKVIQLEETISAAPVYEARKRVCDLGYLRHAYRRDDGRLGWRCPSEPTHIFEKKGGDLADSVGRKCVCNGLLANITLAQVRPNGDSELPLFTAGDDVAGVARFLPKGQTSYNARDVIAYLEAPVPSTVSS
ncbi:MAG: nitronate monooxygenase [Planctomycetota bacterium]|nr:nitronate monooxygenase [Planctomycetota bacterium]